MRELPLEAIALAAVIGLAAVAGAGAAQNAEQTGTATTCADFNAAWPLAGLTVARQTGNVVEVEAGTVFHVDVETGPVREAVPDREELTPEGVSVNHEALEPEQPRVYVDFYDEEGAWVHQSTGHEEGYVPLEAAYGTVCVGQTATEWPQPPDPDARWSYQDGY